MKTDEAVQLVDSAISQLQVNRETHVRLQQAIEAIREAVKPKKEEKK